MIFFCENPSGALSNSKKVKIKGVSSSENLFEVLEDEDLPFSHYPWL